MRQSDADSGQAYGCDDVRYCVFLPIGDALGQIVLFYAIIRANIRLGASSLVGIATK